jgi:serine phosphatase RsbU (regulator of sigma subunit)/tetratricopeptide (TPR) repeat protein
LGLYFYIYKAMGSQGGWGINFRHYIFLLLLAQTFFFCGCFNPNGKAAYPSSAITADSLGNLIHAAKTSIDSGQPFAAYGMLKTSEADLSRLNIDSLNASWHHYTGLSLYFMGNFADAAEQFFKSLSIYEQKGDGLKSADIMLNIGAVYGKIDEQRLALNYYKSALGLYQKLDHQYGAANAYNNLGNYYKDAYMFDSAIAAYNSGFEITRMLGDTRQMAALMNNIGIVFDMQGHPDKALESYKEGLKLNLQAGALSAAGDSYLQLATYYLAYWEHDSALRYLLLAKDAGEKTRNLDILETAYLMLSAAYKGLDMPAKSLSALERHMQIRSRLSNDEQVKRFTQMEMQFQFDKKQKEQEFAMQRQKILSLSTGAGLFLAICIAGLMWRNYQIKRKDNELLAKRNFEIARQRDEISLQKKEITDSIFYASRIQKAALPAARSRDEALGEHFIFFKPRDIVSGDFYWMSERNGCVYFAAADCTGHGVPGAFMSLLGVSLLNQIVESRHGDSPAQILSLLRAGIISYLHQTGEPGGNSDGMDMALVKIDKHAGIIDFAGAYNPVYIARNGEILEIKADRMPVGVYVKNDAFTHRSISYFPGDTMYLFSDGFPDQFGGPEGRKLKTKGFKELVICASSLPISQQMRFFEESLESWKGDKEQIDDILVAGIKL